MLDLPVMDEVVLRSREQTVRLDHVHVASRVLKLLKSHALSRQRVSAPELLQLAFLP